MILVLGKNSQIAQYLEKDNSLKLYFIGSDILDLTNLTKIKSVLQKYEPELIINLMSFNDVDKAEYDDTCMLINYEAVSIICDFCLLKDIPFIHFSSNDVFSTNQFPITENIKCNPINRYGESKFLGEKSIMSKLNKYIIIRTSWVYGSIKNKGFLSKIFESIENGQKSFYGVYDYVSSPTSCTNIKNFIEILISKYLKNELVYPNIFHITDQGYCSKYMFLKSILKIYFKNDMSKITLKRVNQKYFSSTKRSKKTILNIDKIKDSFNYLPNHWSVNLKTEIKLLSEKK